MIEIKQVESEKLWENFVTSRPHTPFTQSLPWGEFQKQLGKKFWRLGIFNGRNLIGVALTTKEITKIGPYLYCQDGPVVDFTTEVLKALKSTLSELCKVENCVFVRLDPRIENSQETKSVFNNLGFKPSNGLSEVRYGWVLNLSDSEESILAKMRKTTRYEIKQGEKEKVEISSSSNPADIDTFCDLLEQTARRKGFWSFPKEYLRTQFTIFAKLKCAKLYFAKSGGILQAAAYLMLYGDTATYLHGASAVRENKTSASYSLQWAMIREAKRLGLKLYDFWGVTENDNPSHPWYGISLFKKGFGGYLIPYLTSQDLPLNYRYYLVRGLERFRKFKQGV